MAIGLSMLEILNENKIVTRENDLLQKQVMYLMKENASLLAENIKLRRYKELYNQHVLWKNC